MTRLTRNIIYNVTGQGLVLVLSLIAVRFIFRRLGDDVFGIIFFNVVLTTVLATALELGISATIVREVSSFFDKDREYVTALIRTVTALYWGLGLLLVAVIWIVAPLLVTHWVNLRSLDPGTAATTLRILSATTLVVLPKALYTSLFRGRQMMVLNNAIDVGTTAAQQAGIFLLILAGAGVYIVAAWISASVILGIIAYVVASSRLVGWSALKPAFSADVVRRTIGFTGNMMVISVLSLVQSQAAQVIVSKLLPIAEFGFYGFAASTVNRATFVTNAVAQAAFPSFSSLFAANDRPGLLLQYRKLQDLVCYGTLPIFTGIIFAAVPVYTYVFNAGVAQRLLLPTAFLALGTWMNATISIPYMLSVAMGKQQIAMRTTVLAIVFVLPVTVLLIYRFGLNGAGLSWVYYHVFAYAYMVPRICRECLGTRPAAWFQHAAKAFGIGVAVYGLAWVVLVMPNEASLPIVVVAYVIATLVFAPIGLFLIGPDLRFTLRQFRASLSKP